MTREPLLLHAKLDGVPTERPPVYWNRALRVQENLLGIEAWIGHYRDKLPQHAFVDEAAIMVPSYWHRGRIDASLREEGWAEVNNAQDTVYTNPFGTRYCVEYAFYTHPDKVYRLEVMMLVEDDHGHAGFSPLHQSLIGADFGSMENMRYPIPHLSFKYPGDSTQLGYSKAVRHLQDRACIHAMTCQSTYGAFGYYIGNETMRQIYIKPRVNLRDQTPIGLVR